MAEYTHRLKSVEIEDSHYFWKDKRSVKQAHAQKCRLEEQPSYTKYAKQAVKKAGERNKCGRIEQKIRLKWIVNKESFECEESMSEEGEEHVISRRQANNWCSWKASRFLGEFTVERSESSMWIDLQSICLPDRAVISEQQAKQALVRRSKSLDWRANYSKQNDCSVIWASGKWVE